MGCGSRAVDDFVVEPFSPEQLADLLRRLAQTSTGTGRSRIAAPLPAKPGGLPTRDPTPGHWLLGTDPEEGRFLAGPAGRLRELWMAVRILAEFVRGFRRLRFVGPCVTVFGSARLGPGTEEYALGEELGARLARAGRRAGRPRHRFCRLGARR